MKGFKSVMRVLPGRSKASSKRYEPSTEKSRVKQPNPTPLVRVDSADSNVMRLNGGCNCLIGGVGCDSGPCICYTTGHGILGTLACLVLWPLNAVLGFTLGVLNCLTCGMFGRHGAHATV